VGRETPVPLRYASKKLCKQYAVTASCRRPSMPSLPNTWSAPRTMLLFSRAPSSVKVKWLGLMSFRDYARVTCADTAIHRPSRRAHTSV
jgi:hypothetical protein